MSTIDIQPLTGRIGAVISGAALHEPLREPTLREVRAALVRHKVIFFRDQKLDAKSQVAFARQFGEITTAHPTVPSLAGEPEVLDLDYSRSEGRANTWHTDVTFVDRPPLGSVLRALTIPAVGGDTLWANSVTAYEDLPASLRGLADAAWAVHSNAYDYAEAATPLSDELKERRRVFTSTVFETLHPVVRVHPESHERGLFIGGFVRQIKDLEPSESADLVRLLQTYVTRPENTVRWKWRVGDVAFWGNRATQHYAVADFGDQPRRVQRVTVAGDVPVSIDGKTSVAIKGDSSSYTPRKAA